MLRAFLDSFQISSRSLGDRAASGNNLPQGHRMVLAYVAYVLFLPGAGNARPSEVSLPSSALRAHLCEPSPALVTRDDDFQIA
jgi:hypothetical protein